MLSRHAAFSSRSLVGFYVAAVAAVAAFPNDVLEQPVIDMLRKGKPVKRRLFLAALFGYLAFVTFALYLAGAFALVGAVRLGELADIAWLRWTLVFAYTLALWHVFTITLLGSHYLVDRIHRADPVVIASPGTGTSNRVTPLPRKQSKRK